MTSELIYITGAGAPGWLSVKNAVSALNRDTFEFKRFKAVGWDSNPEIPWSKHIVPSGAAANYPDVVIDLVDEHRPNYLVPVTDPELIPLAEMKTRLAEKGCKVLISDSVELTKALDKEWLYKNLLDISPLISIVTIDSLYMPKDHYDSGDYPWVKLVSGYGSRGTKRLVPDLIWENAFATMKPQEFGQLLPFSCLPKLLEKFKVVVVDNLPGAEYSIDCLFDEQSELVFYGVRAREVIKNGICHTARFVVDDGEFFTLINKIREKISFKYNINIQVKRDREGKLKLLEINPRIGGTTEAFNVAGYQLIKWGLGMGIFPEIKIRFGNTLQPSRPTPAAYSVDRAYRTTFLSGREIYE